MIMEKEKSMSLDPLESPLWAYIFFAANTEFTGQEKSDIVKAQNEWEKEFRRACRLSKMAVKNP